MASFYAKTQIRNKARPAGEETLAVSNRRFWSDKARGIATGAGCVDASGLRRRSGSKAEGVIEAVRFETASPWHTHGRNPKGTSKFEIGDFKGKASDGPLLQHRPDAEIHKER